jgi:hypothetical protein
MLTALITSCNFPGRILRVILGITLISGIFFSCKGKETKTGDVETACVTLTSTQVKEAWVDPGYTNPASDNLVSYIDFQATLDEATGKLTVNAQGFKADNTAVGSLINLNTGTNCPTNLPAVEVGKNLVDMSKLNILEPDGKLKTFSYIQLTPTVYEDGGKKYLSFSIEVVEEGGTTQRPPSLPCPPCIYCRPPCDTLIDNDTSRIPHAMDTTRTQ